MVVGGVYVVVVPSCCSLLRSAGKCVQRRHCRGEINTEKRVGVDVSVCVCVGGCLLLCFYSVVKGKRHIFLFHVWWCVGGLWWPDLLVVPLWPLLGVCV